MFLAGDPEQPGRAVGGAQVVPDPVALDARDVHAPLGQPPQRRRAERAQPDHDHVVTQDFHRFCPYPRSSSPARTKVTWYFLSLSEVPMTSRPGSRMAGGSHTSMRASSVDRDRVIEVLQRSFAEGRLDRDELDERLG